MKLKQFVFLWICLAALLTGCENHDEPEVTYGNRTVLVYMAADNSLADFALADLEEMKAGMAKVYDKGVHLLVYIDYAHKSEGKQPRLIELKNENGKVIEEVVKTYADRNSVGVSETQEVFADAFSNSKYRAESYGLIYWSHGDGWIPYPLRAETRWVGQDEGDGDNRMNISELVEILKEAPHLDFLLFDACFMQSVEVAYALRDYTDYYIASPTEIPGPGAMYDALVPALFSVDNVAVNVANAYYKGYEAIYDDGKGLSNDNWTAGASICALRTDRLEDLATATREVLPAADYTLRGRVFNYDKRSTTYDSYVGYYDWVDMMRKITSEAAFASWKQVFDSAVEYWATTPLNYSAYRGLFSMEGTQGVSCYIPSASNTLSDQAYRTTEWYTAAGFKAAGW